jgi:hypothetical protein
VPIQGEGLVLGDHENPAQIGVDAVREGDVHNPIHPAKGHGGLGTIPCQGVKAFPLSTREKAHDGVPNHELLFLPF